MNVGNYTWRRTTNINVAAALLTCGAEVLPVKSLNEKTGKRITEFHIHGDRCELPAAAIPEGDDPHHVRERFDLYDGVPGEAFGFDTGPLKEQLSNNTLEAGDATHPALDALRTLEGRECLRTYMERGTRYRMELHGKAPRARYVEGDEPLRLQLGQRGFLTWSTADLALAAAVGRLGCPVLDIIGAGRERCFVLPKFGHKLAQMFAGIDVEEVVRLYRLGLDPRDKRAVGELARQCPEHPVIWGMAACRARLQLIRALEQRVECSQVFLHHHRSLAWERKRRSVLVEEAAPGKVLDEALRHLRK